MLESAEFEGAVEEHIENGKCKIFVESYDDAVIVKAIKEISSG